jgi:hypothetical protein
MPTIEEFRKFDRLAPADKIEARISWLERKMVEVLWLLIGVTALVAAALVAWFVGVVMETRSFWLYGPVSLVAWGLIGWLLKRKTFQGAPPPINFIPS